MGTIKLNFDGIEASGPDHEYVADELIQRGKSVEAIVAALEELDRGVTPEEILGRLEAENREEAEAERSLRDALDITIETGRLPADPELREGVQWIANMALAMRTEREVLHV